MHAAHPALSTHPTISPPTAPTERAAAAQELLLDSTALLRGQKSVTIAHNGALYRLQATKLGKLILTK